MSEQYPIVLKAEALVLFKFLDNDVQKVSELLGIDEETIRRWHEEYRSEKELTAA